ncbi:putative inactive heme oxygenase 2 [Carex littledalei]|uniref:Putative inactive heme oxygenase 2 n=1 Tax=Carex littledalei TaxID=544730 RepID=A0A833QJ16_9POAL|nr:putative inactive heme oxygenase 2 [Carex littledalei]
MRIRDDKAASEAKSDEDTWQPDLEGFLKYLVDSKLVFETVEQIINDWNDPAYIHFRKGRLERTESLMKDLEWFKKQGCTIPEPSPPGKRYSTYLKKLAESSAPSFLCHYYNLYFAHATGGVGIGQKVKQKLLGDRELEFYSWDGDVQLLLKDVRDVLNKLGMQWTRDEKNKCLKEAAKSFRFMGQIVRLIVLL